MSQARTIATEVQTENTDLSEGEWHTLLVAETRRTALNILVNWSAPITLDDLAVEVVTRAGDGNAPDQDSVERTALGLHHVHLPKMAATGIIDYDPGEARIDSCSLPLDS